VDIFHTVLKYSYVEDFLKIIAFLASIPFLVHTAAWAFSYSLNPSPEKIEQAGELIAQAAIPWWVSVIQFLASAPFGILGTILILVLLYLVAKGKIA
jgi:hypothetical protein